MLDPISILTATGFAIQVLDFLLKSGIETYMVFKRSESCALVLNDYRRALFACKIGVRKWTEIWHGFEDDTYIHFWGKETFDQVQELLSDIRKTNESISRKISGQESGEERKGHRRSLSAGFGVSRSPSRQRSAEDVQQSTKEADSAPASSSNWEQWKNANCETRQAEPGEIPLKLRSRNLAQRIAFTLFKDELLRTEVGRLNDRVEQLDKITRDSFRELRGEERADESPARARIMESGDELRRATNFGVFSNELHRAYRDLQHDCPWALELRVPADRSNQLATQKKYNLDLDFALCQDGDPHGGMWRRLRIKYDCPVDAKATARALPRRMITAKMTDPPSRPADVVLLGQVTRRSKSFRPLLDEGRLLEAGAAKDWEKHRAALLLGLVDWVVLMWNSPWSSVPCCCGIRVQISSGYVQFAFSVDEHENCRGPYLADQKLLQLGLTIAELIIGTSITVPRIRPKSSSRVMILERWDNQGDPPKWVSISRDGLLGRIEEIPSCEKLSPVVEYCLDFPLLGSRNSLNTTQRWQVMRNIVWPVREHYNIISEHREVTRSFKFWKSHGGAWPASGLFESTLSGDSSGQHLMPGSFPV